MGVFPASLPRDYETWTFKGGAVVARAAVMPAVRDALTRSRTLYAWAARQDPDVFTGRGEAYGVSLGGVRAVVRHARRGGWLASWLRDRYLGAPRFLSEIDMSQRLAAIGIRTPQVLAGVMYAAGLAHRADVATARVDGTDMAELFFGPGAPAGEQRTATLRAVGDMVRRLHDGGFIHLDLQLRNVLVAGPTAPQPHSPTIWLLDVDTCRAINPEDTETRRANLARFDRSWRKWNDAKGERLTAADHAAFMAAYESHP